MNFIQRLKLKMTLPPAQFKWAEIQDESQERAKDGLREFVAARKSMGVDPPGAIRAARNMIWAYTYAATIVMQKEVWDGEIAPYQAGFLGFGTSNWLNFVGAFFCVDCGTRVIGTTAKEPALLLLDGAQRTYRLRAEFLETMLEPWRDCAESGPLTAVTARRLYEEIQPLLALPPGNQLKYLSWLQFAKGISRVSGAYYATPGWDGFVDNILS